MRGRIMRTAATASMISNARVNKAKRQAIQSSTQSQPAPIQEDNSVTNDTTEQLKQFADLHAQGILTDEEFTAKKKQILGI